ncbi:MAG: NADH-quinone oxidoreductase subunit H [Candidatus Omnitrophica bacterium]|nr:NADH-quinone oxidoreductase subunit H [Candidatus Omnitrophota bacterium]MDD5437322.1 NADH-quinone oxidoreductase subunit H [Candidatus Omnitrophota bacterium]
MLILSAPLVSGVIRKIKNDLRMRRGPGVFQPYYDLAKLFAKDEVVSENASWVFTITPFVVLASCVLALLFVPMPGAANPFVYIGDLLAIIFLLALGRFFLALAGLDTGSAFGGMGSSREMFISSLVEPVIFISIFAVCASPSFRFSSVVAGIALVLAVIAETSRIPVDNQETHLELTMIHEAMVLEYSGRSLALLELAAHIKQVVFFSILANCVFPVGILPVKILIIAAMIALVEVSVAKMRLFRAVDFLSFAIVLSVAALVISAVGL